MAQSEFSLEAVIFVLILIAYIVTSHIIEIRNVPYLHQSTVAIILGMLTGILAKYGFHEQFQFSSQFFFAIILPPIIFAAGYSLRKSLFFENFGISSYLGIIGTILGYICIVLVLFLIKSLMYDSFTVGEVLMLAAILCATDTVAAISLIKAQKYPTLNSVLFGEGIINDAVAIILFRTVEGLKLDEDGSFTFGTVGKMIFEFFYLFLFSLLLGIFFGFGLSYLLKINQTFLKFPIKQTSLILLNGYITYLLGQVFHLSGIISLFTCSIIMGHYCFMNISQQSQRGTGLAFQTVSYMAQAFVYAYLGASIVSLHWQWIALGMSMIILLFLPLVRGLVVFLLPGIYAIMKKPFPLKKNQLQVCWFSGMVRGVIAFALCLQIQSQNKDLIRMITMIIALITTILGSSTLRKFVKWVGIGNEDDETKDVNKMLQEGFHKTETMTNYQKFGLGIEESESGGGVESEESENRTKKLEKLENKYIKPIFQKKNQGFSYQLSEVKTDQ